MKGWVSRVVAGVFRRSGTWERMFRSGLDMTPGAETALASPMRDSVWVQRAIKYCSGPVSAVSLRFSQDKRRGEVALDDPAISAFWERPAVGLNRGDFIEATVGWLKLKGHAFWLMDDSWLTTFGTRNPLIVARPDRMRPVLDARTRDLVGWEYTRATGRRELLLPEQVVQPKLWNPEDDVLGLGEYESARVAVESDVAAGKFARDLMANNGDRGVYVIAKGAQPSPEQQQQIKEALRMKRHMARNGRFVPAFLGGDLTIEDPKVQAVDANLAAQRLTNRHEIALAFGVPPSMFDVVASYSVGSASDRFRLIEETCMPLATKLADAVEQVMARWPGRTSQIFAWFNWDEHSVMQAVRRERLESALKLWGAGMPMQKVSTYLDLGLPEFDGWDQGFLPFSVAPVGALGPVTDPGLAEPVPTPAADPVQQMMRALQQEPWERALQACCKGHAAGTKAPRDPARLKLWEQHMRRRAAVAKAYQSKITAELMVARAETLKKVQALAAGRGLQTKAGAAAGLMFDLALFRDRLLKALRKAGELALQVAGQELYDEVNQDNPWQTPPAVAQEFLTARENRLANTADEVWDGVRSQLQAGLDAGDTMDQLSDRVKGAFNDAARGRARTIAMTETAAAYGTSRDAAMKKAGIRRKQWLTSGNDNVRVAHAAAEGQTVDFDKPFTVGGEELMFPGDPNGSPENVINCHCVQIAVRD
jgi:HK97 family phage portal protein